MKLRVVVMVITVLMMALILGAYFFVQRNARTPIADLVAKIEQEKEADKKKELVVELGNFRPAKAIDFKVMAGSKDAQIRQMLLASIQRADRFRPEWIEMLDANRGDLELLDAVITAIARLTNKDDAPLLLDLLKKRGGSLDHADALLTQATVAALASMKDARAMKYMIKRPDLYFGHGGGSPLAQFGAAALPVLAKMANNPSNELAWDAGRVIAQIQDPDAVPMLMDLARKGGKDAKLGAVSALAAMKVKEAEPLFQQLISDPDFNVREEAIRTLLESDFEGNFDKGVQVLESDDVGSVKSAVLEQMVQHKGAMDKVEAVIKKRVENEPRPDVRAESVEKLMDLNYEKHRPLGLDVMAKEVDPTAQCELAEFFAEKREAQAVPILERMLKDEADTVRFAAHRALLLITKKKYAYEETSYTRDQERFENELNPEYSALNQ